MFYNLVTMRWQTAPGQQANKQVVNLKFQKVKSAKLQFYKTIFYHFLETHRKLCR